MRLIITLLFVVLTTIVFAQKTDRAEVANSDFTTTPFQDGQAKGINQIVEGFYFVEEDIYKEGDVVVNIPTSFNPATDKFSINGSVMVLKMTIYDMAGEKIYEGKITNDWDGKNTAGQKVEDGLYIYAIEARITPGRTSKIAGFVKIASE